jgi:hypothetical protein
MGRKKIRKLIFVEGETIDMQDGTYLKIEYDEEKEEFQMNHYTNYHTLLSINNLTRIGEGEKE